MPFAAGQLLHNNRYRIDALMGQGGMGAVYRAWDLSLDIPVAIKENLDSSPEAQKQFGREAQILARLAHPNLPRVTDYFFVPGQGQYLVMDFVAGEDLQSMLRRLGRLPEPEVLTWIGQICDAVAYLHSQPAPIIHRDIKPANIRIRPDGRAILVDFGIAKVYDPRLATTMGAKAISPGYSPPEQYGGGVTDARSDIYALGATLYHLLTGQQLPESVQRAVGVQSIPRPRELNGQIGPVVEQAILKAIEVTTDRRFQRVGDLAAALGRPTPGANVERPTVLRPPRPLPAGPGPTRLDRPRRPGRPATPWLIGGAALIGLVLAALLLSRLGLLDDRRDTSPPPAAALSSPPEPTPLAAPSLSPAPPLPTATSTPRPTVRTAAPSSTPYPQPAQPVAYRPSVDESMNMPSLLNQVTYQDPRTPRTITYPAAVESGSTWRWGFSWCASDSERLVQILAPLTVDFYMDGQEIPDSAFIVHAYIRPSNGWACRRWSTLLTGWPAGRMVELEVRYHLAQGIYDGNDHYAAGEYRQIFYVTVR